MPRRERPLLALVAAAVSGAVLAACGSSAPPGTVRGAGGVRYQWPPAVATGAPGPATFCRLLVDDYQHLKSITASTPAPARARVLGDFAAFTPTLVAAAPPAIAPAASTYVRAEADVLTAVVRAGFDLATFDRTTLVTLESAPVSAAGSQLAAYSSQRCHYDLAAHAALSTPSAG